MGLVNQSLKALLSAALSPQRLLVRGPTQSVSTGESNGTASPRVPLEIALTFDDGPDPQNTARLLDRLLQAEIKATFFVIGERAARHPQLVRRMADEGHQLGNHTYTHSEPRRTSTRDFLDEVRRTRSMLQDLTGHDCRLLRPPKGQLTLGKLRGLLRERLTVVLWNTDPRDFAMTSPECMRAWVGTYRPQSGDIVLLHDNHPYAETAVDGLSTHALHRDRRFVRIGDWIGTEDALRFAKAEMASHRTAGAEPPRGRTTTESSRLH